MVYENLFGFLKENLDHSLSLRGKRILVHVSGGPDSVFLLHFLCDQYRDLCSKIYVLTMDFGLRKEAEEEVAYVKTLCGALGVEDFFSRKVSLDTSRSIQGEARKFRLEESGKIEKEYKIDYIFLAHHRDDFLETMFLKMNRAAASGSLAQFNLVYLGKIVRPLINISKEEITNYLDKRGIKYYVDSSNALSTYDRNYLRLKVFKSMDERFPQWRKNFHSSFSFIQDTFFLMEHLLKKEKMYDRIPRGIYISESFRKLLPNYQNLILGTVFLRYFPEVSITQFFLIRIKNIILKNKPAVLKKLEKMFLIYERGLIYWVSDFSFSKHLKLGESLKIGKKRISFLPLEVKGPIHLDIKKEWYYFSKETPVEEIEISTYQNGDKIYMEKVGHHPIKNYFNFHGFPQVMRRRSLFVRHEGKILFMLIFPRRWLQKMSDLGVVKETRKTLVSSKAFSASKPHWYSIEIQDDEVSPQSIP